MDKRDIFTLNLEVIALIIYIFLFFSLAIDLKKAELRIKTLEEKSEQMVTYKYLYELTHIQYDVLNK